MLVNGEMPGEPSITLRKPHPLLVPDQDTRSQAGLKPDEAWFADLFHGHMDNQFETP